MKIRDVLLSAKGEIGGFHCYLSLALELKPLN
jgi:hypothetical protein